MPARGAELSLEPTSDFTAAEAGEAQPGGATTSRKTANRNAFSHAAANLSFEQELDFKVGNGIFKKLWVSAPASTKASDGLGPLYNARSCQRCHLKDGRGHPPAANPPEDNAISMLMRLSIPPRNDAERAALESGRAGVIPEPTYGGQLQDFAIQGLEAEGWIQIEYEDIAVTLGDGETITLQKPLYSIEPQRFGPLHPETMMSPRVAPPMIGLGLLELIEESDILAVADPDDRDGDGISGKANRVWSDERGQVMLGRFGWKAGQPSLRQQTAGAFAGDIGISTTLYPAHHGDCTESQADCRGAPSGNSPKHDNVEASDQMLELVLFYSRHLAVPARRDADDPQVLAGKRLFYESGCIACHRPKFVTGQSAELPQLSTQLIWPYTDMLLHDMGEGLADNRPEARADGREWRTPPLWGIGLTETVNGHTRFLHDGRAHDLLEAVLWHGGEAQAARDRVVAMDPEDREALLRFLGSL